MIEINNHDTRQAHYAAENTLQKIRNDMTSFGRTLDGENLKNVYSTHVNYEATKIGMGSTADGMKLLGAEIEDLYISLLKIKLRYQNL